MSRFSFRMLLLLCAALVSLSRPSAAQGTADFSLKVDRKPNSFAILSVVMRLSMSKPGPYTFTLTDPDGISRTETVQAGGNSKRMAFPKDDFAIITPPPLASPVDPLDPKQTMVTVNLTLTSDFDDSCQSTAATPVTETWKVAVSGGGTPLIAGVCPLSFRGSTPAEDQNCFTRVLATTDFATVPTFPNTVAQQCASQRPGLDAILVLDKSGSMASQTLGTTSRPKIEALRDAANGFVTKWEQLRSTEQPAPSTDRIGLVTFDTTGKTEVALGDFDTTKVSVRSKIGALLANGSTAMGQGLRKADDAFAPPPANPPPPPSSLNRRVVLLMSNGMQNVDPLIGVDSTANPTLVQFYNAATPNNKAAFTNQSRYQIYSVTIGTSTAVSADINMNVAKARGGFYLNSEVNAEMLNPFFLELLQNFLHFNSYETLRLVSGDVGEAPLKVAFPLSTTARMVSVTAQWPARLGVLRLTLTAPGGQVFQQLGRLGSTTIQLTFPIEGPNDPTRDWVAVLSREGGGGDIAAAPGSVPVNVTVLSDELALESSFRADSDNFVPGQPVRLHAALTEFGEPVKGIGGALVRLVRPGATLGDLLSDNQVTATQAPGDVSTEADARLRTLATEKPGLFVRTNDTAKLFDDGKASHGDDHANDGIYSTVFTPSEPGHYDFLFGIEGSGRTRRFSRQQLLTVHVRPIPSPTKSEFNVSTNDGQVSVQTLLRTPSGSKFGPGFGNYLWLTSPNRPPTKLHDNFDGTYSALLGAAQDPIALHFLDTATIIQDDVPSSNLPGGLDGKSVIVPDVRDAANGGGGQCHGGCCRCGRVKSAQLEREGKQQVLAAGFILALGLLLRRKRPR